MKFNSVVAILVCLLLACNVKFVKGQSSGLSAGIEYEMPVGQFGFKYKAAPSYNLSYLMVSENSTINITVGHANFKSKQDLFYYLTNDGNDYGVATFSNFEVISAYLGFVRHLNITDTFRGEVGFNFGAYFSKNIETYDDYQFNSTIEAADKNVLLAPKAGVAFQLSDRLVLRAQAKYNFFTPTFKNDANMPMFNTSTLVISRTWSSGIHFAYLF